MNEHITHSPPPTFAEVDRRLTLSFGVVILALLLVALFSAAFYLHGVMEREERQLSTLLSQVLADSVSRVSFSGRYHAQLLLEDIDKAQPDVRYALITDRDGEVLASSDPERVHTRLQGEALEHARAALERKTTGGTRHLRIAGEPLLEVTMPYRGGFDHSIQGVLQVGISKQTRELALRQGFIYFTLLLSLLLAAGMFAVRALSIRFGNPVKQLASDMAATLHAIPDLLFELDRNGRYLQVMTSQKQLLANTPDRLLGSTIHQALPGSAAKTVQHTLDEAAETGASRGHQIKLFLQDGVHWFELSVARKEVKTGQPPTFIVLSRDISERKKTEENLFLYANAFEHSGEAIMITDRDNRVITVNPTLLANTGYRRDELIGENPRILSSGRTDPAVYNELWSALNECGYWQGELWDRRKDGGVYPKWAAISAIRNEQGTTTHYIASYTDISERKAAEERLDFIAHHDPLTGLFNRFSVEEQLEKAILRTHRERSQLAILLVDMDRFKNINDSMGHHTGDELLIEIAERLKRRKRESDITARLGGDEFVVVLTEVHSTLAVANVADELCRILSEPYQLGDKILHTTPSIGITIYPSDGSDVETLMKHADTAMYYAKERGRNNFQFFTAALNLAIAERLLLENDLREALKNRQLELHYQPICDRDQKYCGVEALARWRHPEKGAIPPDKFIPVAEETGLIHPLGLWVIEEACRQRAEWREAGFSEMPVSVNLSVHQLYSRDLVDQVREIFTRYQIGSDEIKFEITESAAMREPEYAIEQMHQLQLLGAGLAIDDFGTGYSSLAYIKRLPVQSLKLDRTFVDDITLDENDAAISAATVALAHNLGLKVVAEGVETEGQRRFLIDNQCDFLQGYLLSRPLPASDVAAFINRAARETP